MIPFTQIPDKLPYPQNVKSVLSTAHSAVVTAVMNSYSGSFRQKQQIINIMNSISYYYVVGDSIPASWSVDEPFKFSDFIDDDICRNVLGNIYLNVKDIQFDIAVTNTFVPNFLKEIKTVKDEPKSEDITLYVRKKEDAEQPVMKPVKPTDKEDLYIQCPSIPRFNFKNPVISGVKNDTYYVVYESLPIIPTKQSEISATTDISKMTDIDILNLFPNRTIQTRSSIMYEKFPGLKFNDKVGTIFPISGFSDEQILDNIIKYPHLFRLSKIVDDNIVSFYSTIEIDGVLYPISDVWKDLPESKVIPYNADFIKEYVVHRYLLERDILGVDHKYKMFGTLYPYLTLFMTADDYERFGYTDTVKLGRACVYARVSYKKSRNPVYRILGVDAQNV